MMYGEIVDNENQELSLIQFFIKQNNLQDKIFCVVPEREKLKKSVEIRNYFENRANNLLSLLNNEKAKELLSHTLTENNKADVKDKVHILLDCINNFRVIVNGKSSNIGIINVRKIKDYKRIVIENEFFSTEYQSENDNALYHYYLIFVLETEALTSIKTNSVAITHIEPNDYIECAVKTISTFLERYGEEKVNLVFEYFFIQFTHNYQYLNSNLYSNRTKLMEALAYEIGGYSLGRNQS